MPTSRPNFHLGEAGHCAACQFEFFDKKRIDWDARMAELQGLVDWAKAQNRGAYDCVVGVSGGKDSTFQAMYARDRLGLRVLLVNSEPEGITDLGRSNIENLVNLGFDTIKVRPNPRTMRKLVKRDFYEVLNPVRITEYSLWASAYIVANAFDVPLIIQGENPVLTVGSDVDVGNDGNAINADRQQTIIRSWESYVGDGIDAKDLFLFHYDRASLAKKDIRGVWLGWYLQEWSPKNNYMFSLRHGLKARPADFDPADIGTYVPYYQLDSDLVQVNQYLKYVKLGFGQCTEHACYDVRDGLLSRKEAAELIRRYDGKCHPRYVQKFCDYIGIDVAEFHAVVERFRGPMWRRAADGQWELEGPIWETVS
jgi:N-acetyl sugar amidotransferase